MDLSPAASPRPHDLLQLSPTAPTPAEPGNDTPAWAALALARVPWVVVRRARGRPGRIPVGVRGSTRAERWATTVSWSEVMRVRSPEDLRAEDDGGSLPDVAATRVFRVLTASPDLGWADWGPTGSVGFSLATGQAVLSETSDLDLLIRCPSRPEPGLLGRLARLFAEYAARVDCQVETPNGAVHLDELLRDGPSLLRTLDGARSCEDPWAPTEP